MARHNNRHHRKTAHKVYGISHHHIFPKSRGGRNMKSNIAIVDKQKHRLYHELFNNMTPDEILDYMVRYFWNSQWFWLDRVRRRL